MSRAQTSIFQDLMKMMQMQEKPYHWKRWFLKVLSLKMNIIRQKVSQVKLISLCFYSEGISIAICSQTFKGLWHMGIFSCLLPTQDSYFPSTSKIELSFSDENYLLLISKYSYMIIFYLKTQLKLMDWLFNIAHGKKIKM